MRLEGRERAAATLAALGRVDTIDDIERCTTRLRPGDTVAAGEPSFSWT